MTEKYKVNITVLSNTCEISFELTPNPSPQGAFHLLKRKTHFSVTCRVLK